MTIEVTVPEIGDFNDVPVVGILVAVGDTVAAEDPLVEIESDKATMEVPSPCADVVIEILIKEGQNVSKGTLLLIFEEIGAGRHRQQYPQQWPLRWQDLRLRHQQHRRPQR